MFQRRQTAETFQHKPSCLCLARKSRPVTHDNTRSKTSRPQNMARLVYVIWKHTSFRGSVRMTKCHAESEESRGLPDGLFVLALEDI